MSPEQLSERSVMPLAPEEVLEVKLEQIPDVVLETVNSLIAKNFNGRFARVTQDEILAELSSKDVPRQKVFRGKWLDIEDIYREAGWEVLHDKPAYNESYAPYFKFEVSKEPKQSRRVNRVNWL